MFRTVKFRFRKLFVSDRNRISHPSLGVERALVTSTTARGACASYEDQLFYLATRPICRSTIGLGAEPLGRGIPSMLLLKPLPLLRMAGEAAALACPPPRIVCGWTSTEV